MARKQKSKNKVGYVYLIKSEHGYKIGHSKNTFNRLRVFNVKLPFEIELIHQFKTSDRRKAEKALHNKFRFQNLNGEWFWLTEWQVELIKGISKFVDGKFLTNKNDELINSELKKLRLNNQMLELYNSGLHLTDISKSVYGYKNGNSVAKIRDVISNYVDEE